MQSSFKRFFNEELNPLARHAVSGSNGPNHLQHLVVATIAKTDPVDEDHTDFVEFIPYNSKNSEVSGFSLQIPVDTFERLCVAFLRERRLGPITLAALLSNPEEKDGTP
jgi:hypothetical protein